ncbi:MAG: DUF2752 domain-containing protein [Thermodesulfobacteriota bacterium]
MNPLVKDDDLRIIRGRGPLILAAGLPLILAGYLPVERLPQDICLFLSWTGLPCPFCGLTRSFLALARGDWVWAGSNCPLAVAIFLAAVLILVWSGVELLTGRQGKPGPYAGLTGRPGLWACLVGLAVILNWVYRLTTGLK